MIVSPNDKPPLTEMWEVACEKARKKGVMVKVEIKAQPRVRTTGERSQNKHINGHIQQICEETGNDFATVKSYIKSQAVSMGYPIKMLNGKVCLDVYDNPIGISESDSSTVECGYLIDTAHRLASELGIILKENDNG